jgi:multiple sugar transport system ATP-binding protein
MSELELQRVSKRFGRKTWAVRDLSLRVSDREFAVLLGPSGCGKTTTLRLIAGLEEAGSGRIILDGEDLTLLPPRKRHVSMVFQNYAVWPHMTVLENIAFPLRLKKLPEKAVVQTATDVARLTGIDALLDRRPDQLSGGQRQRVALARALAVKPKLFLMDEPFSNLDAMLRVAMRTELRAIHQQAGTTTVFVTHDQAEAMSMADRIVIMKDGAIVQVGTPDDVYFRCANVFVAGFIGTPPMNFFDVRLEHKDGRAELTHPGFGRPLTLPASQALSAYGKQRLRLGVRPEDLLFTNESDAVLSGPALVVEPQGSHQVVSMRIEGQIVKIVRPPLPKIEARQTVRVGFSPRTLHFFDPDTGDRLAG